MRQTPGQAAFRRLQYAFGLLAGALIIVGVAGVLIGTGINRSAREKFVRDAIPLKARVQDLTLQMVNQETGVRGYLITANVVDLQPFRSGRAAAAADLEYINQRVGNHPILGRLVAVAMPQIDQLSTYFDAQIALAGRGPSGVAEARQRLAVGKELFDQFRVTADKMNRDTDKSVRDAQHNQDNEQHPRARLQPFNERSVRSKGYAIGT